MSQKNKRKIRRRTKQIIYLIMAILISLSLITVCLVYVLGHNPDGTSRVDHLFIVLFAFALSSLVFVYLMIIDIPKKRNKKSLNKTYNYHKK